jgi:hypothetical protein
MPISDPFISLYSQFINLATTQLQLRRSCPVFHFFLAFVLEQTMQTDGGTRQGFPPARLPLDL